MNDFSRLDEDILPFHILPRLDGETLTALSSVSPEFRHLIKNNDDLWWNICTSTWPSLLCSGEYPCQIISKFPGSYSSFFSQAFPSIDYHHPLPPPPPPPPPRPLTFFVYAMDIFLQGQGEPFYTDISLEQIGINWYGLGDRRKFFHLKKEGCEEYLEKNLRFSCVVIEINRKRAGSLFNPSSCKPVLVKAMMEWPRGIEVVYKTFMPAPPGFYKEMVKCEVKITCCWEEGQEDRFYMRCIKFTIDDMNGKRLKERDASIIISNFIENGDRKKKNN